MGAETCPQCGAIIFSDTKECPRCGARITHETGCLEITREYSADLSRYPLKVLIDDGQDILNIKTDETLVANIRLGQHRISIYGPTGLMFSDTIQMYEDYRLIFTIDNSNMLKVLNNSVVSKAVNVKDIGAPNKRTNVVLSKLKQAAASRSVPEYRPPVPAERPGLFSKKVDPSTIILKKLPYDLSVCKLDSVSNVDLSADICFVSKTSDEISMVCKTQDVPLSAISRSDGWRGFYIDGELDFEQIGILSGILKALADAKVSVFAVSTFNTDYILVKTDKYSRALGALTRAGYDTRQM